MKEAPGPTPEALVACCEPEESKPMPARVTRAIERQRADALFKESVRVSLFDHQHKMPGDPQQLPAGIHDVTERPIRQAELNIGVQSTAVSTRPSPPIRGDDGANRRDCTRLLQLIANGSIRIKTIEDFRRIVSKYPGDPELLRIYAVRLAADNRTEDAAWAYARAATLFFSAGTIFKGWLCKLLEWRLHRPSREQLAEVQKTIMSASPQTGIDEFIKQLTAGERMAIFSRVKFVSLSAGKSVVPAGERLLRLYVVIAGILKEEGPGDGSELRIYQEMDCFGSSVQPSTGYPGIRSMTRVELMTISREHLLDAFHRFPSAERKLNLMYRPPEGRGPVAPQRTRKGERYLSKTFMNLRIPPLQAGEKSLVLKGFSHEISLTGISFIPEQHGRPDESDVTRNPASFIGREVYARILAEGISVEVQGQIVRMNEVLSNGDTFFCFNIKFAEVSPLVRSMLLTFAATASINLAPQAQLVR